MANSETSAGNLPIVDDVAEPNVPSCLDPNDTEAMCNPPEVPGSQPLVPGLYLVATPIGNATDITLRALDILSRVDIVLCEDTRTSGKLMKIHKIHANLQPYHEHNAEQLRPMIMKHLNKAKAVAMI